VEELTQTKQKLKSSLLTLKRQEKEIATLYVELGDVKTELLKTVDALGLLEGQKAAVTKLLENDQKVGYLHKKSPYTKLGIKVQKRYFVLRGGNLYYYKTDKEYNAGNRAHPTGVIPLDNITINVYSDEQSKKDTGALHAWEIKNSETERIFVLIAPSDDEKIIWCDLLYKATGIAKARSHTTLHKTPSKIAENAMARLKNMGIQRGGAVTKNQDEDPIPEADEAEPEISPKDSSKAKNTRTGRARGAGNFTRIAIENMDESAIEPSAPSPTCSDTTPEPSVEETPEQETETGETKKVKSPRSNNKKSKK